MGYLEYACSIFFDKDWLKTRIMLSSKSPFSQLYRDEGGFACVFPEPKTTENEKETISLMGYHFPVDVRGKRQLASLFRATVFHLSGHVLTRYDEFREWRQGRNRHLASFINTVLEDAKANAYVISRHPDRLADLAFANALGLGRLHRISNLINPATRLMAGLLIRVQTGLIPTKSEDEHRIITHLASLVEHFRERAIVSIGDDKIDLNREKLNAANEIYGVLKSVGPITETPFFPHTEELGACSIFSPAYFVESEASESDLKRCWESLGGNASEGMGSTNGKMVEAEATQVFDSWRHQKEKDRKTISKYGSLLSLTRFKSIEIPKQDYTEYLRVKSRCKSESHRLIESLLVARDALDEDPRKIYGVLDLQEVIQVIASKSPRMDVFMLDENLSKSYSWVILLDASKSMKYNRDFALELLVVFARVANELLLDPHSWGMYAFNDRFFVVKDLKERFNAKVESRIGGLEFEGFTYLPDALKIAGQVIKSRAENLRLITVISDGWPYGYPEVNTALTETIETLEGGSVSLIGIGAKSGRMSSFFRSNCSVYNLRELTKRFSDIYFEASRIAVGT